MKSLVKFNVIHRGTRKVRALIKYEPMDVIQSEIKLSIMTVCERVRGVGGRERVCVCVGRERERECVCLCGGREREMLMLYAHIHSSCHAFLTFFPIK